MDVDRSWPGVVGVASWQIVASASYYGVFAATASLRAEFGLSSFQIGMLLAALTLGYTLMLFPAGAVVDGYGDKPVMIVGLTGLGIGAFGVTMAPNYLWTLLAVFLLGGTYATAMPATNRAIAARAPPGRYNLAINVKQVGVTGGSAIASILVTNIQSVGGVWQTAFRVIGGTALLIAGLVYLRYRNTGGSGSLSVPDFRSLRGNRPYMLLAMAGFFVGAAVFSTTGYLVPFFEDSGSTLGIAGIALASMQVAGSAGRIGAGGLTDRLSTGGSGAAFRVMGGQLALAAALLVALPVTPLWGRLPVVIVLGLGLLGLTGLFHGTLVVLVPDDSTGAATAGGQTLINSGGLLVPPVFGLIADSMGYRPGWWLLAGLALSGVLFLGLAYRSLDADAARV